MRARASAPSTPARGGQPDQDRERWHARLSSAAGSRGRRRRRRAPAARRSSARSRSAPRARRPSRRARSPVVPPISVLVDEHALEGVRARSARTPRPGARRARRSARRSTTCCTNSSYSGREARRATRAAIAGPRDPDAVGDRDAGEAEQPCRAPGRRPAGRRCVCGSYSVESAKVGRRKSSITKSTFGICTSPAPTAPSASTPIATRIGSARSAIAWCGPGKPTSVSSTSPLAGLRGTSAWCRWPASSSRASGHGLAVEGAEDHPEGVDRGQERADVADHVQRPVPAAALAGDEQDLVLGEEARERRDARQREAADDEAAVGERHRLAEAAHLLERLLAAHRADDRAGAP